MIDITQHKSLVNKIFREAMKRHGVTKSLLENDSLRHRFFVGFRKDYNWIRLEGDFYCPELWKAIGKPERAEGPLAQYIVGNFFPKESGELRFESDDLDVSRIEEYFEWLIRDAVVPIVTNMQTPAQSVEYFRNHRSLLLFRPEVINKYMSIWTEKYNLEKYVPKDLTETMAIIDRVNKLIEGLKK